MSEIQVNQRWRQSACSLRGRRLKGNGKEIPGAREACKGKEKESSPPPLSLARGLAIKFPSFSNACHAGQVELRKEFYKNHNESLYKQGNCWCPFIKLQSQILESFRLELRLQQTSYHLTMFVPGLLFIKLLLKICSFECRVYAKELLGTLNFFNFFHFWFSRGFAARGFGLRPKMCRPSAKHRKFSSHARKTSGTQGKFKKLR